MAAPSLCTRLSVLITSALLHIEVPTWKRTDVGWSSMAGTRRLPREKATAALSTLLEAICAGGAHADCVTAVYVFGSYARGALTVGDVDVDIEYDARLDPAVERELMDNLLAGRDWNTPFRKALKPARALQVLFSRLEMIAEPVLVYQRGDTRDQSLARVAAIAPDPEAGRAERDPVHPAIEPVAEDLARPTRILLTELLTADLLGVELVPSRCGRGRAGRPPLPDQHSLALAEPVERSRPCGSGGRKVPAGCRRGPRDGCADAAERPRSRGKRLGGRLPGDALEAPRRLPRP
jgi:hypothetical protein